jgi:hypothetical protein
MTYLPNYDIFISYSHKDAAWVMATLLPRLELHGFSVIVDSRGFRSGEFGVEEMQRAVEDSRRVILVLTENYIGSDWAKFENVMAQTLDPGAKKRKIIPVLRETCRIPLRLRILQYRDLRDDDPVEWDLLVQDLI